MKNIAILIPIFNRIDHTKECLRNLTDLQNTLFFKKNKTHLIVIDDGSTDGSSEWIRVHYPDIIILTGNGDLWWSGAMNMGIRYGLEKLHCDFILFWENDIVPFPEYFNHLHDRLENWEDKTIVCSKIFFRNKPNTIYSNGGIFNAKSGYKRIIGWLEENDGKYDHVVEADWFCGQGILLHNSVFKEVGFLDEKNFPQYHGDSDFALRAKKKGFRNLVFPDLKIFNDTSTTGISHNRDKTLKQFIQSLFSIRSNNNIIKDIKFYRRHTTNIFASRYLLRTYFIYTGSYIKWKFLGYFGVKSKNPDLY